MDIFIQGAKANNLKNISVSIPTGKLTCITGVSGSGKSSLIEDCIVKEANRRHKVLSRTTKRLAVPYLPDLEKAIVPFVVYISQGLLHWNSRSTIATITGILPRMRDIIVKHGVVLGKENQALVKPNAKLIADWSSKHHTNEKISVLTCLGRNVLGSLWPRIENSFGKFPEIQILAPESNDIPNIKNAVLPETFKKKVTKVHRDIFALLNISSIPSKNKKRLEACIEQALSIAKYPLDIILIFEKSNYQLSLNGVLLDLAESRPFFEITPTLLSFNSYKERSGQCGICDGTGTVTRIKPEAAVKDNTLPLASGGLNIPYDKTNKRYKYFSSLDQEIRGLLKSQNIDINSKWDNIDDSTKNKLLYGCKEVIIQPLSYENTPKGRKKKFVGIIERIDKKLNNGSVVNSLLVLRTCDVCQSCNGTRLNYAAQRVFFEGISLQNILKFNIESLGLWLKDKAKSLPNSHSKKIINDLANHCNSCKLLGLGHLTLDRSVSTLSGGEAQRLRIAELLSTKLKNICYILDEPTRGLHTADAFYLTDVLRSFVDKNTSVVLAEHNPAVVQKADHVIELGPEGGNQGGEIIYEGESKNSPLVKVNSNKLELKKRKPNEYLSIQGINLRNIKNQNIKIPIGMLSCVTGVSGSGKTTLVRDIIVPAVNNWLETSSRSTLLYSSFALKENVINKLIYVGQNALSNNPRSILLSFLGLSDNFRSWFYSNSNAQSIGLKKSNLSFNTESGQCASCNGLGYLSLEGLEEYATCPSCLGEKYSAHALSAIYREKNIKNWLDLSLSDVSQNVDIPDEIRCAADLCIQFGIGHLSLSRSLPTLSGGECQRLRIIKALLEVNKTQKNKLMFILDEPAAGLHPKDVERLCYALHTVVDLGHTIVLVEHNLNVIANADWIIDMGPLGAEKGGQVDFVGLVEDFLESSDKKSITKQALLSNQNRKTNKVVLDKRTTRTATQDNIKVFETYLSHLQGETSNEQDLVAVNPSYVIGTENKNAYEHYDILSLTSLSLPLFRFFACNSYIPAQRIFYKDSDAISAGLTQLKKHQKKLVGYFPLTNQLSYAHVTQEDIRVILKELNKICSIKWTDGEKIHAKPPSKSSQINLKKIRVIIDTEIDTQSALKQAFTLGEGWFSLISPKTFEFEEITTRCIDFKNFRAGSRWQIPQIFDSAITHTSCQLCKGSSQVETIDFSLVVNVHNSKSTIKNDDLFTKMALQVIKSARKKDMLPAIKRLADANLIDLNIPYTQMKDFVFDSFWYGYPDKYFLRKGGNKEHKGDWYRWRGMIYYIIKKMWNASDRSWSESINNSRSLIPCPRCSGTGLGWEARMRKIKEVSLYDILKIWTLKDLSEWLLNLLREEKNKDLINIFTKRFEDIKSLRLEHLICGSKYSQLSEKDKLKIFTLACSNNSLLGAEIHIKSQEKTSELNKIIERNHTMKWLTESK